MVIAIMVITVAALIAVLATTLSFHSQSTSQLDRKRAQSIAAAEAGVDTGLIKTQVLPLPCTSSGTLPTVPTTSRFDVTYTYYDTYPPVGAPLACDASGHPVGTPATVVIKSKGSTNYTGYGDRTFESLAKLTPIPGNTFNKAIFANATLTIANNTTINGNVGNDGDLYTNKDFQCVNSLTVKGSVYTQGFANMANSCAVANDVYAKSSITMANSASIGHDAKAAGGNITLFNNSSITHDAIASGTISAPPGAIGNNRVTGASLAAPPTQQFPQVVWDAAAWAASPYDFTNVITNNTCSGAGSVYTTIAGLSATGPNTAVLTNCALSWANNTNITFGRDVAIFSSGGFTAVNNFTMKSNVAGTTRKLYWIVPYTAATSPCVSPGIFTSNQTIFTDLDVFFYSPCDITAANKTTTNGQIFGGSNVTIANLFTLTYVPLPVTGVMNTVAPIGYNVDIIYKRETLNG